MIGQIAIKENEVTNVYHIPPGEYIVIGRSSSADIKVVDNAVSKHHCKIFHDGDRVILEDLKSRNFTFLNGKKVETLMPLKENDIVTLGRVEIKFSVKKTVGTTDAYETVPLPTLPEEAGSAPSQDLSKITREEAFFIRIALSLPQNPISKEQLAECVRTKNLQQRSLYDVIQEKKYLSVDEITIIQRTLKNIFKRDETDTQEQVVTRVPIQERIFVKVAQKKKIIDTPTLERSKLIQKKYLQNGKRVNLVEIWKKDNCITREQILEINSLIQGDQAPFKIDGYQLIQLIGVGGMGYIYKAKQISMDRLVAIKILSEEYQQDTFIRDLFLQEARSVAKLNHENIVAGFDFGECNGVSFFVMEYVDGLSLQEKLEKIPERRLSCEDSSSVISQVAKALEHANSKGLIHRDIKPENILLANGSIVKLCDLGIAQTKDQQSSNKRDFGTPAFMSPEQIRCEPNIDIRSDIYSLGITFYRVLFGRLPFTGTTRELMAKHLVEPIKFPENMDSEQTRLSQIIQKMVAKERRDRYQNPAEIVESLQETPQEEEQEEMEEKVDTRKTMILRCKRLRTLRRRRRR